MHKSNLKIFIASSALLLCSHLAAASLNAQEAYKVDEVIEPRCDFSEVPQITDPPTPLFTALDENKEARAAIIVYGMEGSARRLAKDVKQWLTESRGVESERLVTLYGGSNDKLRLELWLIPRGASLPKVNLVRDYKITSQFDSYAYQDGDSCGSGRFHALIEFAEALKKRPEWQGYIVVRRNLKGYGHISRRQALLYAAQDKRYLVKKFGLSPTQIKAVVKDGDGTYTELWIIPPGAEPPVAKVKNATKER